MAEQKPYSWSIPRPPGHLKVGLILKNAAISYPDKEIIDANTDTHRSYREVNKRANRIANGLLNKGKSGDFVAVLTRWGIETLETYFACARAGMVFIPVSYRLVSKEIETILRYAGANSIIFDEKFKPIVDQIDLKLDRYIIGKPTGDLIGYDELFNYEPTEPDIEIKDDTPITLGFTSGTTGTPKAYIRTHYANFLNHICYTISFDMTYQDIALNALPPFTGLTWDCGMMLARGVVINLDFDPVTALKAIEKYKVTVMYGVPAMFEMLLNVADFDKYDISSLNRVASVGAVLPQPTLEKMWDRISPNVYDHIGLQETGFVAVSKPDMKRKNPEYLGPPVPLQEIRIVDEQGKDKPLGEIGELIYRYPDGAGEYWKNPEKTKEAIRDGWFYSGDLGKVNEDGHLAVVGRTKDMIVSGAYNVFAIDVEEQIMKHPKVADCAVIGLPDKTWGEKVAAVIKLKSGETSTEEEMINYCKEMMSHYKAPKTVIFADVPRTASGKAVKFELVEKYKGK